MRLPSRWLTSLGCAVLASMAAVLPAQEKRATPDSRARIEKLLQLLDQDDLTQAQRNDMKVQLKKLLKEIDSLTQKQAAVAEHESALGAMLRDQAAAREQKVERLHSTAHADSTAPEAEGSPAKAEAREVERVAKLTREGMERRRAAGEQANEPVAEGIDERHAAAMARLHQQMAENPFDPAKAKNMDEFRAALAEQKQEWARFRDDAAKLRAEKLEGGAEELHKAMARQHAERARQQEELAQERAELSRSVNEQVQAVRAKEHEQIARMHEEMTMERAEVAKKMAGDRAAQLLQERQTGRSKLSRTREAEPEAASIGDEDLRDMVREVREEMAQIRKLVQQIQNKAEARARQGGAGSAPEARSSNTRAVRRDSSMQAPESATAPMPPTPPAWREVPHARASGARSGRAPVDLPPAVTLPADPATPTPALEAVPTPPPAPAAPPAPPAFRHVRTADVAPAPTPAPKFDEVPAPPEPSLPPPARRVR